VAHGAGLAGLAATIHVADDVELAQSLGQLQGLLDHHHQGGAVEVTFAVLAVDNEALLTAAGGGAQVNARHGGLTTPRGLNLLHGNHQISPQISRF
jgi:hypothetical protein